MIDDQWSFTLCYPLLTLLLNVSLDMEETTGQGEQSWTNLVQLICSRITSSLRQPWSRVWGGLSFGLQEKLSFANANGVVPVSQQSWGRKCCRKGNEKARAGQADAKAMKYINMIIWICIYFVFDFHVLLFRHNSVLHGAEFNLNPSLVCMWLIEAFKACPSQAKKLHVYDIYYKQFWTYTHTYI